MLPFLLALAVVLTVPLMMIRHQNRQYRKRKELEEYLKKKPWDNGFFAKHA